MTDVEGARPAKPSRPRWWQFTIMRLLVLTAFCAVLLGWYRDRVALREVREQVDIQQRIAEDHRRVSEAVRIEAEARLATERARVIQAISDRKIAEQAVRQALRQRQLAEEQLRRLTEGGN